MKKITLILKFTLSFITLIGINLSTSAQVAGDYRSIASGNWNDPTKWEMYGGSNWVNATNYPGQSPGTGDVTILSGMEMTVTATVPQPIASLKILDSITTDYQELSPIGKLTFSSENSISLIVAGSVTIFGGLVVADQNGTKRHLLSVGGSMIFGSEYYVADSNCYEYPCSYTDYVFPALFQPLSNDDNLAVKFSTTIPNSSITGVGGAAFQDVIFDGIGISVNFPINISGNTDFINGVVSSPVRIYFTDGATVSGGSNASFVEGRTWKRGNDPFTFPIGSNGIYSPLTISAPANVNDVFSAYYARSASIDPALWGISDSLLYKVSNCEYWVLNSGEGVGGVFDTVYNGHVDVTIGWTPYNGCGSNISNAAEVTLAHFFANSPFIHEGTWDNHAGSGVGTGTSGSVTSHGLNKFGAFTLGNINTNCVTPYGLKATNITPYSAALSWSPVVGAGSYDVTYNEDFPYYRNTITVNTSATSINLSSLSPLTTFDWKVRANCSSPPGSYRWGPQFNTLTPCAAPTELSATNITISSVTLTWAPALSGGIYYVQYKPSTSDSWISAANGIGSLSFNINGLLPATKYDWRVAALCSVSSTSYISDDPQSTFTTLACNDVFEINNNSSQAKAIILGTNISAIISSISDIDWFKVTMPNNSNTTLQVALSNLPSDYDLYVYDKNLVLVGSSTNTGTSSELVTYYSSSRKVTYYIKVVGKNGAFNSSQCYNLLAKAVANGGLVTTSIPTNEITATSDDQSLYPNPASEFIYLHFTSTQEETNEVDIVNSFGQIVKRQPVNVAPGVNQVKIPVSDINPGIYLLRISKGELNMTRKFVIAR